MKKRKNIVWVMLALVLVAAISAAVTFAYRDRVTLDTVDNTFTNGRIKVKLVETEWDNLNVNEEINDSSYKDLGKEKAIRYISDTYFINLNPTIYNITDPPEGTESGWDLRAWVGIKARFYVYLEDEDGNMNTYTYTGLQFTNNIARFNNTGNASNGSANKQAIAGNWETNEDYTEFYKKQSIGIGQDTGPMFRGIVAAEYARDTEADGTVYYKIPTYDEDGNETIVKSYSKPEFDIDLKPCALQYSAANKDYANDHIKEKLHALMNYTANMGT